MITGSINSNVAQRTNYYGMLRCLGAGKNQVRMLVRLEALFWCKLLFQQDVCWESFPHGDCVPSCVDLSAMSSALYQRLASAGRYHLWFRAGTYHGLVRGIFSGTAGGKSFSDHSSNWECGGKCSGFSVSCSVVWKSCRAFFGREPCNLVQKELASDDRFLCVKLLLFLSFSVLLRWVGFALNPLQPYTPDLSVAETSGQMSLTRCWWSSWMLCRKSNTHSGGCIARSRRNIRENRGPST